MAKTTFRLSLVSTVAALAMAPGFALANEQYSVTIPTSTVADWGSGNISNPGVVTVDLPQFNGPSSGAGSLTGIVITLTAGGSGSLLGNNNTAANLKFTKGFISGGVTLTSEQDANLTISNTLGLSGISGTVTKNTLNQKFGTAALPNNSAQTTVAAADFIYYEGTNTTGVNFDLTAGFASGATTTGASLALSFGASATLGGTVTILYETQAPIPEPGSLAVLGAGLIGAGVMRRRAKRTAI